MFSTLPSRQLTSCLLLSPIRILVSSPVRFLSEKGVSNSNFGFSKPSPSVFDEKTVCEALQCYANDWRRALEFFDWLEVDSQFRHTTETFNRMIDILGKFFEFETSWDMIRRMNKSVHSVPNHTTFRIMFKRYASARLVQEAVSAYYGLEDFNLRDETSYYNLIDALCEYKHVIEAEELCFGKSKINNGFKVSETKIHNMILRGWFKLGWWSKCRDFWEDMDKKGVVKDMYSYSIYMDIVLKGGKPWKSVKLYKEMKRKKMKLDVIVYNTVIQAMILSQGVDFGLRVFREMRDLGCEPNIVTYNTVIKHLCENRRTKEAYGMLSELSRKGLAPDSITFVCIFRCLEKPHEILSLFNRMIDTGVRPKMSVYVLLMRKFGRWGFLRPILDLWKKMEELGDSPNEEAYFALIDALVEKGMLDMARKYQEEMLAKGFLVKPRLELVKTPEEM